MFRTRTSVPSPIKTRASSGRHSSSTPPKTFNPRTEVSVEARGATQTEFGNRISFFVISNGNFSLK
jgi:hypothetical protein